MHNSIASLVLIVITPTRARARFNITSTARRIHYDKPLQAPIDLYRLAVASLPLTDDLLLFTEHHYLMTENHYLMSDHYYLMTVTHRLTTVVLYRPLLIGPN